MQNCKIPTIQQCDELFEQCHTPKHIIRHCQRAADFAVELAKRIAANGVEVNIDFVHRACLLHDILRLKGEGHEEAAFELLKDKFPEIALAIKKHAYRSLLDEQLKPTTIEEKIVYYADKRVMHDKIVPLKDRLADGHKRNMPKNCRSHPEIKYIDSLIYELEKELFRLAKISGE